ncbi:hypothetical protein C0991_003004, partial [Blastosporella zonata]
VARADRLSQLAHLELANLEAVLDVGGADAKGDEEEEDREDGEAKMAGRYEEEEEAMEAERAASDEEEVAGRAKRERREEAAERAERGECAEATPGGFRVLPRRAGSGLGRIAQRKRDKMAAKRAAKGKMRRG